MDILTTSSPVSTNRFIKANTEVVTLSEIENHHIIPVFAKDNELSISHAEFVKNVFDAVHYVHSDQVILPPSIRVSHPVHGRIPDARDKQPNELAEHEKTLYYERMIFAIEVPSIVTGMGEQSVNLVVGGVKSYHRDKLSGKWSEQLFKVYVGFKVNVCSNLCIASDGAVLEVRTKNPDEQLIGTIRVQYYHPDNDSSRWLGDQQIGQVVRGYYENPNFKADSEGNISVWNVYNLFTEANKSSYVDSLVDRSAWCFQIFT
jgi:hypothetical protein